MKKILLSLKAFFLISLISACSFHQELNTTYGIAFKKPEIKAKMSTKSLKILPTQAPIYLRGNEIIYFKENEMAGYKTHFWKSSAAALVNEALFFKFEESRAFRAVVGINSQLKEDLVLESKLLNFEQIFKKDNSSSVKIVLSINLFEKNELLAHQLFEKEVELSSLGIKPSVEAFERALNELSDSVLWYSLSKIK